jgi:thiol-disulfide isomerase/thioredoxin
MTRWRQAAIGVGVLVGLQLTAWALYRTIEGHRGERMASARFDYEPTNGTSPPYDIVLERADGQTLRLADAASQVVLMHFWATWCAPCRTELPTLIDWADGLGRDSPVRVLLVSVDEDWATIRHFFDGNVPARVVRDGTAAARRAYGVSTLPDSYILKEGLKPIARIHGARDWGSAAARETLSALLSEAAMAARGNEDR